MKLLITLCICAPLIANAQVKLSGAKFNYTCDGFQASSFKPDSKYLSVSGLTRCKSSSAPSNPAPTSNPIPTPKPTPTTSGIGSQVDRVVRQAVNLTTILPGCANGGNFVTSFCGRTGSMAKGQKIAIAYKARDAFTSPSGQFSLASEETRGRVNLFVVKSGQKIVNVSRACKTLAADSGSPVIRMLAQRFIDKQSRLANQYCGISPGEQFHLVVEGVSGDVIRPWVRKPSSLVD